MSEVKGALNWRTNGNHRAEQRGLGAKGRSVAKRPSASLFGGDAIARFMCRGAKGRFKESYDVGRSLRVDRRKKAKRKVGSGYGDKGDR
jgi:hypothetical protein